MRYAPQRDFPPYAFLPGRDPHPVRDPAGHSYGLAEDEPVFFAPDDWRENELYLFGADLYNHGFLWEAHEAWETIWHPAKRDPIQALHLQGLIQCSAACLKIRMQQPRGFERLLAFSIEKLERVQDVGDPFMGLELEAWLEELRRFGELRPLDEEARPRLRLDSAGLLE